MGYEEEEFEDEEEEVEEESEEEEKPTVKKKLGKKGSKKSKPKEEYLVVKELPVQQIRSSLDEETGITTNYLTMEESLTRMENKFRELTGDL